MPNSQKALTLLTNSLAAATFALLLSSCSAGGPAIEGKYQADDSAGSSAEFLADGTLIFVSGGKQGLWTWAEYDNGRLKLTPGGGLTGTKPAICTYTLTGTELRLSACHLEMTLTRL